MHAARLADKLGVSRIVIPRNAGVGSAIGFLMAPIAYDVVVSRPLRLDAFDEVIVQDALAELATRIRSVLDDLGEEGITTTRHVDMRYAGQGHEVTVPLATHMPDASDLRSGFEARYVELFGRSIPGAPIEVVPWQARLARKTWRATQAKAVSPAAAPRPVGQRGVFDARAGGFIDYAVYERSDFAPGASVPGPALVVEDETTTVATSNFIVSLDARGHLILIRNNSEITAS